MQQNQPIANHREMTRASFSLKSRDYDDIARIAAQKKVSIAWVIREAVEKYLEERSPLFKNADAK